MTIRDEFAAVFAAMQRAWEERNVAEKAPFSAARRAWGARSFDDGDADEMAAAEDSYDGKIDAMNAAVDTFRQPQTQSATRCYCR